MKPSTPTPNSPPAEPETRRVAASQRLTHRTTFRVAVAVLALLGATWAVLGSSWIFPQLSANSDEGVYLLQADTLASGVLQPDAPEMDSDAFRPWFSVAQDGHYVLKYTPVYASVLAIGQLATGTPRAGLALTAAVVVVLVVALARELGASRPAALMAGAIYVVSPLVLQLSITYLPYGVNLALFLGAATAALRAVRTGSTPLAAVAGLSWGLMAFGRPYDAVLAALVIVGALAVSERRRLRALSRLAPWAALGAAGPLLGLLVFNDAVTGDPLQLPFNLLEPRDGPGFGERRALPTDPTLDYTLQRATASLGRNALLVVAWTGGGIVTAALGAWALWRRRFRPNLLLIGLLVVWPLGYAFFWGSYLTAFVWDGALFLGPYYYLPMVAALAIAGGVGLTDLWERHPAAAVVALFGVLLLSGLIAGPALADQLDRTSQRTAVAEALDEQVDGDALVFVPPLYGPHLQNPLSFLRNNAHLDGERVYALDRDDAANARLREIYPDRPAYRLSIPDGWSDQPGFVPTIEIIPLPAG